MEAADITGQCLCGKVRFRVPGPPRDVHHCHGSMCRRATGAAFATLVWVPRRQIEWQGKFSSYRSSDIATRSFCSNCGTSLFLAYDDNEQIALLLGSVDQPERLVPTHHYGIEARLAWVDLQQDLPGKATDVHPQP